MKKYIAAALILAFPLIALAKAPSYSVMGTVTKVTDGDTIKIQTASGIETVRILGLDSPENSKTRFGYIECYGDESTRYVESVLPIGSQVYVEFYGNDRYARDLGDVYIGSHTGSLLADQIISN
jgi:endonuclease YncB( thermonuclease family)